MNSSSNNSRFMMKDEVVFMPGQGVHGLYLVQSGRVMTFRISEGRVIPLSSAAAGEFIGEEAVFHKETYNSYAVVLEDAKLHLIGKDDILEVIMNSPDWVKNLIKTMAARLAATEDMIHEFKIIDEAITDFTELDPKLEVRLKNLVQKANS